MLSHINVGTAKEVTIQRTGRNHARQVVGHKGTYNFGTTQNLMALQES